jgi:hypothetical protein
VVMGIIYNPIIVTDPLVLCVDIGNRRSYVGTGTSCSDLKSKKNYTISNGPTFSSQNRGRLTFDGTDDYIEVVSAGSSDLSFTDGNFSVGGYTRVNDLGGSNTGTIFLSKGFSFSTGAWFLYIFSDGKVRFGRYKGLAGATADSTTTIDDGLYHHVFATMSPTGSSAVVKIYIDGKLDNTTTWATQDARQSFSADLTTSANIGFISGFNTYGLGDVSLVQCYNRELTADEVRQNYLATKGRYQ